MIIKIVYGSKYRCLYGIVPDDITVKKFTPDGVPTTNITPDHVRIEWINPKEILIDVFGENYENYVYLDEWYFDYATPIDIAHLKLKGLI